LTLECEAVDRSYSDRVRIARVAVVIAIAVVLATACSNDSHTAEPSDQTDHTKLATGVIPPPPLTKRDGPSVSLVGTHVIVFGGVTDVGDTWTVEEGGAVFDRVTGKWSAMAPAPFAEPLFFPAAVPAGDRLIVVGSPCREVSTEAEPSCNRPVDVVGASYDPNADHWDVLPSSGALREAAGGIPAYPEGWSDPRAVFDVAFKSITRGHRRGPGISGLLAYNTDTKDWERIPEVEGTFEHCTTSDAIVATARLDANTRPTAQFVLTDLATFVWGDGKWTRVEREPVPVPGQESSYSQCGTGVALYLPWRKGAKVAATWLFTSAKDGWRRLPEIDISAGSSVGVAALTDGTRLLALTRGSRLRVFSMSAESGQWSARDGPDFAQARLVGGDDAYLLVPIDPLKDGLFIGAA
jgi:hypothetical protein